MPVELRSPNRLNGVGLVRRYPAGHSLGWADRAGVRRWTVGFPDRPPVPFDTRAEAEGFAERVQREADRRERRRHPARSL